VRAGVQTGVRRSGVLATDKVDEGSEREGRSGMKKFWIEDKRRRRKEFGPSHLR